MEKGRRTVAQSLFFIFRGFAVRLPFSPLESSLESLVIRFNVSLLLF